MEVAWIGLVHKSMVDDRPVMDGFLSHMLSKIAADSGVQVFGDIRWDQIADISRPPPRGTVWIRARQSCQ